MRNVSILLRAVIFQSASQGDKLPVPYPRVMPAGPNLKNQYIFGWNSTYSALPQVKQAHVHLA